MNKIENWIAWKRRVLILDLVLWLTHTALPQTAQTQKWFGETLKAIGDDMIRLSGGNKI